MDGGIVEGGIVEGACTHISRQSGSPFTAVSILYRWSLCTSLTLMRNGKSEDAVTQATHCHDKCMKWAPLPWNSDP